MAYPKEILVRAEKDDDADYLLVGDAEDHAAADATSVGRYVFAGCGVIKQKTEYVENHKASK